MPERAMGLAHATQVQVAAEEMRPLSGGSCRSGNPSWWSCRRRWADDAAQLAHTDGEGQAAQRLKPSKLTLEVFDVQGHALVEDGPPLVACWVSMR